MRIALSLLLMVSAPMAVADDAKFEGCRAKLKAAVELDMLTNMTFDKGIPKIWVGPTWHSVPVDAKEGLAATAACFFTAGGDEVVRFDIFDGMTGKRIARWSYTKLVVE